jgi:low affinity Fe/Cu permease
MAQAVGSAWAFVAAIGLVLVWGLSGPFFHFSDTWQLVINTGTTIVTFLLVFLIQNTQNRDARAIHLKLDELLRGVAGARTGLVDLENLTDEQLDQLQRQFQRLRQQERVDPAEEPRSAEPSPDPGRTGPASQSWPESPQRSSRSR